MMLNKRSNFYAPASLAPGATNLLGTTVRFDQFDRTYPWEFMLLILNFTAGGTAPATLTVDGLLNFIRNINLSINPGFPGRRGGNLINSSTMGLLEYMAKLGVGLDVGTLALLSEHTKAAPGLTASNLYQLIIPIPFVDPRVSEPLRSRMLLDVHNHKNNPVLTLDFSSAAQMYGAGSLTTITAEIFIQGRDMDPGLDAQIMKDGGYFQYDLLESAWNLPIGQTAKQVYELPGPGFYSGLLLRQYLGGASVTRGDIGNNQTPGSEDRWSLNALGRTPLEWRSKHLRAVNDYSNALNSAAQATSPSFFGKLATNTQYQNPNSLFLDFLTDGLDTASELGSLLDADTPAKAGQKIKIQVDSIANAATNASYINIIGHRFYNDNGLVDKWRSLRAA